MRCELTARAPGVVARETPAGARCGAEFEADVVRGRRGWPEVPPTPAIAQRAGGRPSIHGTSAARSANF